MNKNYLLFLKDFNFEGMAILVRFTYPIDRYRNYIYNV